MNYAINGLGRIGRAIFRILWERNIETCIAVNDAYMDIENIAYLLMYDSLYGRFRGDIAVNNGKLIVSDETRSWEMPIFRLNSAKDFARKNAECDILIESSGAVSNFADTSALCAGGEIAYGIITHECDSADFTLIFGLNEQDFDHKKHRLISSCICDGNAIAPVLHAVNKEFGIKKAFITSLHPWLSYQNVLDGPVRSVQYAGDTYKYYQLGRMSSESLIPKTTSLGGVLLDLLPEIEGKLVTFSYRTPTSAVCSADISLLLENETTTERAVDFLASLKSDYIAINHDKLISSDFKGVSASCTIDLNWVDVQGDMLKLVIWYDNEWGYSHRVADAVDMLINPKAPMF